MKVGLDPRAVHDLEDIRGRARRPGPLPVILSRLRAPCTYCAGMPGRWGPLTKAWRRERLRAIAVAPLGARGGAESARLKYSRIGCPAMALSRSAGSAFLAVSFAAIALCGCSQNTTTGAAVTDFDPNSTAARFRSSGAPETTLAAFCKSPPRAATPAGAEAIKVSCSGRVLARAGDARLFDKGNGLFVVIFPQPIRNGDICDPGTQPQSICGNFASGDKMSSSRIDAG
jgi:hypothetical protein